MRVYDRDLIRGGHYGQRSCEPHLQAEHMAAPTNAAKREESSCQLGAVHTWHKTDMPKYLGDVRCWVNSGKHLLALRHQERGIGNLPPIKKEIDLGEIVLSGSIPEPGDGDDPNRFCKR